MAKLRPLFIVIAIPLALCLIELPSGTSSLLQRPYYLLINLALIAILFAIVYLICQRTRGSVIAFLAVCLILGGANYYLVEFKGAPLMPADLFAISTAGYVASSYSFAPSVGLVIAVVLFAAYCVLLHFVPKLKVTVSRFLVSTVVAVVVAGCFGWWMSAYDIEEALNCEIDTWDLKDSYAERGSMLCFVGLFQDLSPDVPDGYSEDAAEAILAEAHDYDEGQDSRSTTKESPTVITVMNETFSDLSTYPGMSDSGLRPNAFYDIADDSLESGTAYVSVIGGGTCNSEFEFLTGSSMSMIGGYSYPYTTYNFSKTSSLVDYFDSYGYTTHAIHPGAASNWRRDTVYSQLGFDDFADEDSFKGADTLRGLVTDRETYDYVLDLLDQDSDPQFIFDVTIQNHGGYDMGGISKNDMVSTSLPDGSTSSELDEYASCIQRSDEDLAYFVEQLEEQDRPIVLCFFGDHQPELSYWLYENTHGGRSAYDSGLFALERIREVPYFIWANDAAREEGIGGYTEGEDLLDDNAIGDEEESAYGDSSETFGDEDTLTSTGNVERGEDGEYVYEEQTDSNSDAEAHSVVTSLNYLGAHLVSYTGLPLSDYQKFLLQVNEVVPAMNLDAYRLTDGIWRSYSTKSEADGLLSDYAIVQYYNLFG